MPSSQSRKKRCGDHPREYGENGEIKSWRFCFLGPSPRIRGKYDPGGIITLTARAIPANTGRIISLARIARTTRDHPREYGENRVIGNLFYDLAGSSHRIRGESGAGFGGTVGGGIIPANTGRISARHDHRTIQWDHPREYGENAIIGISGAASIGSSPRIRGEYS